MLSREHFPYSDSAQILEIILSFEMCLWIVWRRWHDDFPILWTLEDSITKGLCLFSRYLITLFHNPTIHFIKLLRSGHSAQGSRITSLSLFSVPFSLCLSVRLFCHTSFSVANIHAFLKLCSRYWRSPRSSARTYTITNDSSPLSAHRLKDPISNMQQV